MGIKMVGLCWEKYKQHIYEKKGNLTLVSNGIKTLDEKKN